MKTKAARADLTILQSAVSRYRELYGCLPDRRLPHPQGACRNYEVVRLLRNWQTDRALSDPAGRDRRFSYDAVLDKIERERLDAHDNWTDPWGAPYAVSTIPDDVWLVYQKMVQAPYVPASAELDALRPYGSSEAHALYWVKHVRSQINVYSFGPDRSSDWGYCFGDGSGYQKSAWGYYSSGDNAATPQAQRGDDIRAQGP
jgi:hypothetical protein